MNRNLKVDDIEVSEQLQLEIMCMRGQGREATRDRCMECSIFYHCPSCKLEEYQVHEREGLRVTGMIEVKEKLKANYIKLEEGIR